NRLVRMQDGWHASRGVGRAFGVVRYAQGLNRIGSITTFREQTHHATSAAAERSEQAHDCATELTETRYGRSQRTEKALDASTELTEPRLSGCCGGTRALRRDTGLLDLRPGLLERRSGHLGVDRCCLDTGSRCLRRHG